MGPGKVVIKKYANRRLSALLGAATPSSTPSKSTRTTSPRWRAPHSLNSKPGAPKRSLSWSNSFA